VHVILATDADWLIAEVTAALDDGDTSFTVCRDGRAVARLLKSATPDLVILDMQIGTMGGIAVTMDLRLDESSGALPHVPILMLLDRTADIQMSRRSGTDGWLIKPLDSLRLRRAARAVAAGGCWGEGLPEVATENTVQESSADAPEGEPAVAG